MELIRDSRINSVIGVGGVDMPESAEVTCEVRAAEGNR